MEYNDEFLKKIVQMGMLGYPLSKIVNVIDIENEEKFKADFYNESHPVCKSYKKGIDRADSVIDMKLFDLAKTGDLDAIKQFDARRSKMVEKYEEEEERVRK